VPVAGTWYHVVAVYDGTNGYVYVNGVLGAQASAPGYYPNSDSAFSIGTRSDVAFHYNGWVDEVALYTNVLTAAEILAHYQNGTNTAPPTAYDTLVKSSNPLLYFRLNETSYTPPGSLPMAINSGSVGSSADAAYNPGTASGVNGVPFSGLGVNNYACRFNGIVGYLDAGTPPEFDITGPMTILTWIKVNQFNRTWQAIVTKGDSAWRLHRNGDTDNLGFGTSGLSSVDLAGTRKVNDGQWHFVAAVYDGTYKYLYVDSQLDALVAATGTLAPNTYRVLIGENDQATGRFFQGLVDEVAIFTNALTAAEIQQVFFSANGPPIITQQPQAPAGQIIAGAPVSVPVGVVGTPTLGYQWLKEGVILPGQVTATLMFGNITTNDAGNYSVVVTNAYGAVTSSIVALAVTYPINPAELASAVGFPAYDSVTHGATLTEVTLYFTGPLAAAGGDFSHYSIPGLAVSSARFTNLNTTVILTTSPHIQGTLYTVTVTGVTDGVGNPLGNNSAQFRAWVASPANGVLFEHYYHNEGATMAGLLEDPLFPNQPAYFTNLWAFDSRVAFPDDSHEQYGARMSGVFVPGASGNWRFFLRSDDASQLYLNPNGPEPDGSQLILEETGCCGDWNKYQSAAIPLIAGQPYYIEMFYKEGGGGDYGKVAARLDGTGYPVLGTANTAIDPEALVGPSVGSPYAPADVGGPLNLTGPTSLAVQANHPVMFSVTASSPSSLPMFYQWRRNGVNIDGETGPSYSFVATPADNGARFTVQVAKLGTVVVSSEALLTVTADTDAPAIVAAGGSEFLNKIVVSFSELMGAQSPASYTVPGFTAMAADLDSTGTNVIVTLNNPLAAGQTYNLTVQNAPDSVGSMLTSVTVPFQAFVFSRGLLKYEYFPRLSTSDAYLDSSLLVDPRFPNSPDWTAFLTAFNSRTIFPDDLHNGYGAHVSGLFVPPEDGNYAFFLRSDDNSRLFLNPAGPDPMDLSSTSPLLETVCCPGFSATGATNGPMVAGQIYRIEAIHKEGGGGDYVQVASKLESDPALPDSLSPIPGPLLGILADPAGASVTITQQPASSLAVYLGAGESPSLLIDANFNANDGGFTVVNYGVPVGPWAYDAAAGSWTNHGQPGGGCGGPFASGLNSPTITLTNSGGVAVTFTHRYSFEGYNPSDGTPWDGGQVRLSVNGGPFATLPPANFTANGYLGAIGGSIIADLTTTPGWVNAGWLGESPGYSSRTLLTSVASLGYFNAGDTLTLQFVTSWDDCTEGQEPNWEIDSVQVTIGAAVPAEAELVVGAESTYRYLPNSYIAYIWQRDTGAGFVDMLEATGQTNKLSLGLEDSGTRYRCLVYGPGASATSDVATVTVTVPLFVARTAPDALKLSWPLPPPPLPVTTFLLEQSPTLAPASWGTVPTNTYQTTAATVYTTVTPTDSSVFYRLRRN